MKLELFYPAKTLLIYCGLYIKSFNETLLRSFLLGNTALSVYFDDDSELIIENKLEVVF